MGKNILDIVGDVENLEDGVMQRINSLDALEREEMNAVLMSRGHEPIHDKVWDGGDNLVTMSRAKIHPNQAGGDKAQFDIIISRATANIAATSLEAAIFGQIHYEGGYARGIVNPAPGGSFVVTGGIHDALPTTVRIAHTVGANTDNINITCNQINYPSFLSSMGKDLFRLSNIRYTLNDPTQLSQFAELMEFRTKSLFGKGGQNPVSISSFKKPEQFQNGIIDIPVNVDIDKETALVVSLAPLVVSITLSVFVSKFNKLDAYNMNSGVRATQYRRR